jgi:hypothetical protein
MLREPMLDPRPEEMTLPGAGSSDDNEPASFRLGNRGGVVVAIRLTVGVLKLSQNLLDRIELVIESCSIGIY